MGEVAGSTAGVRPSAIRQRVLAGEPVAGAMMFEFFAPGMPQVLKAAGCEFALFDMEHAGLGFETLKMLAAGCRGIGIEPLVRVPRSEYHFMARALDVGAYGVMVPMVESAEEARRIAEATHYPPQGRRGAAFGVAQDDYSGGDVKAKVAALNARTLVIAQIESERGLAELEGIAATPGIDIRYPFQLGYQVHNFWCECLGNMQMDKRMARESQKPKKQGEYYRCVCKFNEL